MTALLVSAGTLIILAIIAAVVITMPRRHQQERALHQIEAQREAWLAQVRAWEKVEGARAKAALPPGTPPPPTVPQPPRMPPKGQEQ